MDSIGKSYRDHTFFSLIAATILDLDCVASEDLAGKLEVKATSRRVASLLAGFHENCTV